MTLPTYDPPSMTRRRLLAGAALLPAVGALASCQSPNGPPIVPAFVGPIEAIGQQIQLDAPQIQAIVAASGGSTPDVASLVAKVSGYDSQIQSAASAIATASTQSQGQSTLITIETYINALAPIVAPILQTAASAAFPGGGLAVGLIVAALPVIEGLVNMTVDQLTAEAKALANYAKAPPAASHLAAARLGGPSPEALAAYDELMRRAGK